jgi:hypothetical protein
MTEGTARALLDATGYRVIEYGVEKTGREVTPMTFEVYLPLCRRISVIIQLAQRRPAIVT